MRKFIWPLLLALVLTGCAAGETRAAREAANPQQGATNPQQEEIISQEETAMKLYIDGVEAPVTWEDNPSVAALRALAPLTVEMSMYGGFEQVGPIGQSIVRDDVQTTTAPGDIVLYSGNQIVVFYGTNAWAYTRLGHVDLPEADMARLLGNGDVTLELAP